MMIHYRLIDSSRENKEMKLSEFEKGKVFICDKRPWLVTDIGSRVVIAIAVREGWMNGPPYALSEMVFDEEDQLGCSQK